MGGVAQAIRRDILNRDQRTAVITEGGILVAAISGVVGWVGGSQIRFSNVTEEHSRVVMAV
jgi:hypothetical protein